MTFQLEDRRSHRKRSLRNSLERYDEEVAASFERARASDTGLERVRIMHNEVRPSVAVHDSVVESVLCPLLDRMPGGGEVAANLRNGCEARAKLLARFDELTRNVTAPNVYPVSGDEIDTLLDELERSFREHLRDETKRVSNVIESAPDSADPVAIAASMAVEAQRSPTRHPVTQPLPGLIKAGRRWVDRIEDWRDSHGNWYERVRTVQSPRSELVQTLKRQAIASPPSVRGVLEQFDAAIDAILDEVRTAGTDEDRAGASHRAAAAIAIHDSVVGGVLCPILEGVPRGREVVSQLREGCDERNELQRKWGALLHGLAPAEVFRVHRREATELMDQMRRSFERHEREGTLEVESLLLPLPVDAYRNSSSPLEDAMWPWHSEGPALLALRMALWAESAPTRTHSMLMRHPSSRVLRSYFHLVDHLRDYWGDTWLERWLFPDLPRRPFSAVRRGRAH